MRIVGLTGSIGMGKSAIAAMLRARGVPVFDADQEVHRLYEGDAVPNVEAAFPGTTVDGRVDRAKLAASLAQDPARFRAEQRFLDEIHEWGGQIAVLEIPLLYETGLDAQVDQVVVVSAPSEVQRERVLARPGMSAARLDALLARQLTDDEKRRRADFVVDTGGTLADSEAQVDAILDALQSRPADAYARHWR
jgi:dephospho-CoA kinase